MLVARVARGPPDVKGFAGGGGRGGASGLLHLALVLVGHGSVRMAIPARILVVVAGETFAQKVERLRAVAAAAKQRSEGG